MKNIIKNIFKNWKTTSAGIVAIVSGITMYLSDKSKLIEALTAILSGIGLVVAQDIINDTKEDA